MPQPKKKAAAKKIPAKKAPAKKSPVKKRSSAPPPVQAAVGVTSQVGVSETWIRVFEQNEQIDEKGRLTDEQISQHMKSEFPNLGSKIFDRVEIARAKYNRGGFHKKDKSGNVVRPGIHSRPYTAQESSSPETRGQSAKIGGVSKSSAVSSHQKDFKAHKK